MHEDINVKFGFLSKKLREQNNYVLMDYGFTRIAIHSPTNSRNPRFQLLGLKLFERWIRSIGWTHKHAFLLIFCGFFWVASDVM
jgi:hypothetical protein